MLKYLKKIRVIVSILFFIALFIIFVDIYQWMNEEIVSAVVYMQFTPSLLKFLGAPGLAASGFIFVILLTLIFGRVYCSSICPLGTLQDIILFIRKRKFFKKKKRFGYSKPLNYLRWLILALTALLLLLGISFPLLILDPYSNFGRITANIFRPIIFEINNLTASSFAELSFIDLHKLQFAGISIPSFIFALSFFILLIFFTAVWGRIFCNSFCPVGALLALPAKISLFKIDFDKKKCTGCRHCDRVCKAMCIDSSVQKLDFSRCVSCFNCIDICPEGGFGYKLRIGKKRIKKEGFTQIKVKPHK